MNAARAQVVLLGYSFGLSLGSFIFFVLSPAFGYPLAFEQALRLCQIVLPIFFGYLATGAHFLFGRGKPPANQSGQTISSAESLLIHVPPFFVLIGLACALFSFGFSNRNSAAPGTGMGIDTLANFIAVLMAILAATTGVAISHFFPKSRRP